MTTDSEYFKKQSERIYAKNNKYNKRELEYLLQYLDYENPDNQSNPWSARLEEAFAKKFGVKYAIAHNSGTSTLHSCLHAIGVGAGDEIIGPVQTGIWFPFVCLHQNAIPVYVDSDPDTFLMDPYKIEEKISDKTKAIIPTHMHGNPSDMDKIMDIAEKYNLIVIEDCAQSFLASYKGRVTGSIGHMSSFSFETKKHMTTGQGGMVLTDDEELAVRIRKHAGLGYKTLTSKQGMTALLPQEFQNPDFKRHDSLAYNYRMPEICAVLGLAQLEDLDNKVHKRIEIANMYNSVISDMDWIIPQKVLNDCTSSFWTYTVIYRGDEKHGVSWKRFYDLFKKNGGDGFFGCLSLNTDEIVMKDRPFFGTYTPSDYVHFKNRFKDDSAEYPIAKSLQPRLMQFKTGYRDMNIAQKAINALDKTIKEIEKND